MSEELCYLAASRALELFRKRELSPVDVLRAQIARAEKVESVVNAFPYTFFDDALEQAARAEQAWARGEARPLEGLTCAIKDETFIEGQVTSNGSLLQKDFVAPYTSPIAERLIEAGAIVHARSAAPEFSCHGATWTKLHGVTRNPWNPECSPGGSSGGAGATLAAGTTTLANGSDIAGSIRIPASMCGVVGFKPPHGRVPDDPPFNTEIYCHAGPMARTVEDCRLMENAIAGPHPRDVASLRPKLEIPKSAGDIRGWRIGLSMDLGYKPVDPDVRRATLAACDVLRAAGATLEEVELGFPVETTRAAIDHLLYSAMGTLAVQTLEQDADALTPYARRFAELAAEVTGERALAAEILAGELYGKLSSVFERCDVLVCPTIASTRVSADNDPTTDVIEIEGEKLDPLAGWIMTYPFNMLSRCPVMSVPSGFADNGVPTGLQIVGHTYDDARVFEAAFAYEREHGPFFAPGRLPEL